MSIYTPRYKPWEHQTKGEAKWGDKEYFALFMAQRTGKTKVVIDHYGRNELAGVIKNLCVLAPGGVYKTWHNALWGDPGDPGDLGHLSVDLRSRLLSHTWESSGGSKNKKSLDYFMANTDQPRALLMNVEALSSVKLAREVLIEFLKSGVVLTVVDECTCIGGHTSKRTKFINRYVADESDFRGILSGQPTPKDPLSLFSELEFLDWRILGHKSFYSYRARYAVLYNILVGGRQVPIVKGFRDLDEIHRKIEPHSYRVLLKDVYNVPEKIYTIREVPLTQEQKRIYKDLKSFCTAQLSGDDYVTATIVIAQITRLHQVLLGHTIDENGKEHDIPENRTSSLIELLSDYDGKAIIWCSYDYDIQKVTKALQKEFGEDSVSRFWGGNRSTREAEEVEFKLNPSRRWMVATQAAGGEGREWSIAKLIVFYSNTDNLKHRDQAEERAQAVGKIDPVAYVDLMVRGTVDEKFVKSMREKINMATAIMGDGWREWLI